MQNSDGANRVVARWKNAASMRGASKELDQLVTLVRAVSAEAREAGDKMEAAYKRLLNLRAESLQLVEDVNLAEMSQADADLVQEQLMEAHTLAETLKRSTDFRSMVNFAWKFYDLEEKIQRTKSKLGKT